MGRELEFFDLYAISARELKEPCIVGIQIATKALKDGDYIELDADKGLIKKMEL